MALNFTKVPLAIQGLSDKTDNKQSVPGSVSVLENAEYSKVGKINKKKGYTTLPVAIAGGGSLSSLDRIYNYRDALVAIDGNNLYEFSEAQQKWEDKGFVSQYTHDMDEIKRKPHISGSDGFKFDGQVSDTVYLDGYLFNREYVVDATTKTIVKELGVETGSFVFRQLASFNGKVVYFFSGGGIPSTLKYFTIDPADLDASISPTTIDSSVIPTGLTCAVSGNYLYFAYYDSIGGDIRINRFDTSFNTTTAATITPGAAGEYLRMVAGTDVAWLIYFVSGTLYVTQYNSSLTATFAPVSTMTPPSGTINDYGVTGHDDSGTLTAYASYSKQNTAGTYDHLIQKNTVTSGGTTGTKSTWMYGYMIIASPISINNVWHMVVMKDVGGFGYAFLIDTDQNVYNAIGNGTINIENISLTSLASIGNGNYAIFMPTWSEISTATSASLFGTSGLSTSATASGMSLVTINTNGAYPIQGLVLNNVLHLTGGVAQIYDGESVKPAGSLTPPSVAGYTNVGTGGLLTAGLYTIDTTYAFYDAKGNRYESPPDIQTESIASGTTNEITCIYAGDTLMANAGAKMVIYLSEPDGTVTYFNGAVALTSTSTTSIGDPVDGTEATPYYTGGILYNATNTAHKFASVYNNRVLFSGLENKRRVVASKVVDRYVGIVPADDILYFDELESDSAVSACVGWNDRVYIFKKNHISMRSGDLGNNLGEQSTLTESEILATAIGMPQSYISSVIATNQGVFFKATNQGIYSIGGQTGLQYVGADVEDSNALTITGAVALEDKEQIRYTTSDGATLVYDYLVGKWSRFTNYEAVGCCIYNGKFVFAQSDATIGKEDTSFTDGASTFVTMKAVTNWISMSDLAGYQRVRRVHIVGTYKSAHNLTVKIAYDYDDTWSQTTVVTVDATKPYEWRVDLGRQKCTAIKISIEDTYTDTLGESFDLSAVVLEIGVKKGTNKLSSSHIFS